MIVVMGSIRDRCSFLCKMKKGGKLLFSFWFSIFVLYLRGGKVQTGQTLLLAHSFNNHHLNRISIGCETILHCTRPDPRISPSTTHTEARIPRTS